MKQKKGALWSYFLMVFAIFGGVIFLMASFGNMAITSHTTSPMETDTSSNSPFFYAMGVVFLVGIMVCFFKKKIPISKQIKNYSRN